MNMFNHLAYDHASEASSGVFERRMQSWRLQKWLEGTIKAAALRAGASGREGAFLHAQRHLRARN